MFMIFIHGLLEWLLIGALEGFKQACSLALTASNTTSGQWETANSIVGKVAGVVMFITMITAMIAMIRATIARRLGQLPLIMFQATLSWPLTLVVLWILVHLKTGATVLTGRILGMDMSSRSHGFSIPDIATAPLKAAFAAPLLILFLLLILIASAAIIITMSAVNFLFILAVCLLPAGIMTIGIKDNWQGVVNYIGWIIGIIIYQPLVALMITLTISLMKTSDHNNPIRFITALVGIIIASVCPWVIIRKLVHIIPSMTHGLRTASNQASSTASSTKQAAKNIGKAGVKAASVAVGGGIGFAGGSLGSVASKFKPMVTPNNKGNAQSSGNDQNSRPPVSSPEPGAPPAHANAGNGGGSGNAGGSSPATSVRTLSSKGDAPTTPTSPAPRKPSPTTGGAHCGVGSGNNDSKPQVSPSVSNSTPPDQHEKAQSKTHSNKGQTEDKPDIKINQ
jgi:hypothetical protein